MSVEKPLQEYQIGDICPVGTRIKSIVGRRNNVLVYINENGEVRWQTRGVKVTVSVINDRQTKLRSLINEDLPQATINSLKSHLAACLYNAFSSENDKDGLAYFNEVEKRIKNAKTEEESRVYYLSWSVLYSIMIVIVLISANLFVFNNNHPVSFIILSAVGGISGAALSIITRSSELKINLLSKNLYIHLQVIIKLFIGSASGVIILLSSKANLIVGLINENNYMLFLFSVAAGFIERFIPEFLTKIDINGSPN